MRLVIATRNEHKAGEIRALLPEQFRCQTLRDFPDAPEVIEDAPTFAENASKKALALARWLAQAPRAKPECDDSTTYVLADDSGLEVDALNGAPGVYSARFAALDQAGGGASSGNSPDAANNAKLLRLLENVPTERRSARFRCVLALAEVTPPGLSQPPRLIEGVCEGRIGFSPRGQGGFGYDPLFLPAGYERSFAELEPAVKNQISHRAMALRRLRDWLRERGSRGS